MALDGKLLAQARERLRSRREYREDEIRRREEEIRSRLPRAGLIMSELTQTMSELASSAVSGAATEAFIERIRLRNLNLQKDLSRELTRNGYPANYFDVKPVCGQCGDTGYNGVSQCGCLMELYREEQKRALSSLFKAGNETFANFDLSYYSTQPDAQSGISPREHMRFVYDLCLSYAKTFGSASMNLFLTGQPGLGKTFLAACIARYVADNGFYSVVYETFPAIFARMESEKFNRADDAQLSAEETRRYRECDLLIADDLGSEMRSQFVTSALYELVNTRLINEKHTIITSNLSVDEVRLRYSPQIGSRIDGEFQTLHFYGDDIRVIKKNRAL